MSEQIILLYSKFSPSCAPILEFIRINNIHTIRTLCIDNKTVRRMILKSEQIQNVPCFLIIRDNRISSKFEGPDAHAWFASFTESILPPPPPPPPPAPVQMQQTNGKSSISDIIDLSSLPPPPPPPKKAAPPPPPSPSVMNAVENMTLEADEEEIMLNREGGDLVQRSMANPQEERKELKFQMDMRVDPSTEADMNNMLAKKDELGKKKKIRGFTQGDALYDDTRNLSGRDMIEHETTAIRSTSGNKSSELNASVEEMRRQREQGDNDIANNLGIPIETINRIRN
jgi:hypothetical protein